MMVKWIRSMGVVFLLAAGSRGEILMQDDFGSGTAGATVISNAPPALAASLAGRLWEGSTSCKYDGTGGVVGAADSYRAFGFRIAGAYEPTDTLRLTVVFRNAESMWAGIGFSTDPLTTENMNSSVGWVNINGDASAGPGGGFLWEGPAATFDETHHRSGLVQGAWKTNELNTLVVEYDLNSAVDDGDGTMRVYLNGANISAMEGTARVGSPTHIKLVFDNGGGVAVPSTQYFDSVKLERIPKSVHPSSLVLEDGFARPDGPTSGRIAGNVPDALADSLTGRMWEGSGYYNGQGAAYTAETMYRAFGFKIEGAYEPTDTLRLTVVSANESEWAGIGFTKTVLDATGFGDSVGWVNITQTGSGSLWEGPGAAEGNGRTLLDTGYWNVGTTNTLVMEYDLKDDGDGDGNITAFLNGTQIAYLADTSEVGQPGYIKLSHNNNGTAPADPATQYFDYVKLEIIGGASEYSAWSNRYALVEGPDGDDDLDGLINLYEFGLGGDPTNALDQGSSPEFEILGAGGTNWLYYVYPERAFGNDGLLYYLELSDSLSVPGWTNAGYEVLGTEENGFEPGFNAVTNRISTSTDPERFVRLIIEESP